MKTIRTITEVRNGMNNKSFSDSERTAVIATLPISKNKQDLGVQFWSKENLKNGFAINSDNTVSKFVELY